MTQSPDEFRRASRARWGASAPGWAARRQAFNQAAMPVATAMIDAVAPQPGHALLELAAGVGDVGFLALELAQPGGSPEPAAYVPMLTAWRRLPYLDPGIPLDLLPDGWPGEKAAGLFATLDRRLRDPAAKHAAALASDR